MGLNKIRIDIESWPKYRFRGRAGILETQVRGSFL